MSGKEIVIDDDDWETTELLHKVDFTEDVALEPEDFTADILIEEKRDCDVELTENIQDKCTDKFDFTKDVTISEITKKKRYDVCEVTHNCQLDHHYKIFLCKSKNGVLILSLPDTDRFPHTHITITNRSKKYEIKLLSSTSDHFSGCLLKDQYQMSPRQTSTFTVIGNKWLATTK